MAYKMKKFSGFGKSPAKQTQGFGWKGLIKAQKELAQQELAFHQPGWARVATSMMGDHPSCEAKKSKKSDKESDDSTKSGGTGGGFEGAADDIQSGIDKWGNIKEKWGDIKWSND